MTKGPARPVSPPRRRKPAPTRFLAAADPEAASVNALFDAFARTLASRLVRPPSPRPPSRKDDS